jgi:hypothetical protein
MAGYSKYEKPFLIRDAAGNAIYESAAFLQNVEDMQNSDTVVIARGTPVQLDQTNSVFPRWDYSTAGTDTIPRCQISVKNCVSGGKALLGVALETIPFPGANQLVPTLTQGRVAVGPTIAAVKSKGSDDATLMDHVIADATAAQVTTATSLSTLGTGLGYQLIPEGTGAAQSGSATQIIILISPH